MDDGKPLPSLTAAQLLAMLGPPTLSPLGGPPPRLRPLPNVKTTLTKKAQAKKKARKAQRKARRKGRK